MRKLVIGCAVAGLIALSPQSDARPSVRSALPPPALMPKAQIGWASWYGINHQGKRTASGEIFDANRMTAAHRALPLGTVVRVTNLANRKSMLLRVNDRGPVVPSRLIDVSWAAARQLEFVAEGLTRVRVEVSACARTCCGSTRPTEAQVIQ